MPRTKDSKDTKPRKRKSTKNGAATEPEMNAAPEPEVAPPPAGHNGPEPLTEDQTQALFFQHKRRYQEMLATKKEADALFKNACKLAKSELGDDAVDAIKDAILLETEEGEATLKARVERQLRIARWMGLPVGAQGNLFDVDRTPAADKAYADGKRAGLAGETAKPPHDPSTEQYREWMRGHGDGQDVVMKGFGKTPLEEATQDDGDVRPRFAQQREAEAADAVDSIVTH